MSGVAPLLIELGRAGVTVAAGGGGLRFRPTTLAPDLEAGLRANKPAILGLLAAPFFLRRSIEEALTRKLREAGARGLATHRGSSAWLVAIGEAMQI